MIAFAAMIVTCLTVEGGLICAPAGEPTLPETRAGQCAAAYLAAFNSASEQELRAFEKAYRAEAAARRRPLDDRITSHRERCVEWGKITLRNVVASGEYDVLAVVEPERLDGWMHLSFELEQEPPYRLEGLRLEGPVEPKSSAASNKALNDDLRKRVIERIADELIRNYAFADVGQAMADDIRRRLAAGEYGRFDYSYPFAQKLTHDLRDVCHDKHLRITPRIPMTRSGERAVNATETRQRPELNYGFTGVEVLPGNVGYIKMVEFAHGSDAQATAAAAMAFVANTEALIFDLTQNGGGSAEMIMFLCGYLFDEPVHLNSFYHRPSDTIRDTYSREDVPGTRYGRRKPVYVLTSSYTFSAAEEFTYDLKHLQRATVVGETSGGGAHPVTFLPVSKYFTLKLPDGRAINPITKTNWEGVGVIPHVQVPADQAKQRAHELALQAVKN